MLLLTGVGLRAAFTFSGNCENIGGQPQSLTGAVYYSSVQVLVQAGARLQQQLQYAVYRFFTQLPVVE